jgi:hypothetical protein
MSIYDFYLSRWAIGAQADPRQAGWIMSTRQASLPAAPRPPPPSSSLAGTSISGSVATRAARSACHAAATASSALSRRRASCRIRESPALQVSSPPPSHPDTMPFLLPLGRLLTVLLKTFLASTFSAFRLLRLPGRRRRSFPVNTPPRCRTCSQSPSASGCHTHSPGLHHRRGRHRRHRRDLRWSRDSLPTPLLFIRGSQRTKHGHRVWT